MNRTDGSLPQAVGGSNAVSLDALVFAPVPARTSTLVDDGTSRHVRMTTPYGSFYGRYWPQEGGWNAFVDYHIGEDIEIHRGVPFVLAALDEDGIVDWILRAYADGPTFVLPILEHLSEAPQ